MLVTGSSRGIGAEIAALAGAEGATVAVHYKRGRRKGRRRPLLASVSPELRSTASRPTYRTVQQAEDLVKQVIERFGRIDGLVNNAGESHVGPFFEITPELWDHVLATDLSAAFHTCRAALPSMVERGSGSIVNIASRLAQMGIPQTAAYSAAKAGLVGLTRSLAREFGPHGIRVNAVAPGFTLTEMTADIADTETGRARLRDMPVGRFARADEVAQAVIFLLSDRASMFLGQTLNPNGGGYMP